MFSIDPKATLHALDAGTGQEIWRKNLVQEYGAKIPPWYNGQNPLIEDDRLVIAPVGSSALIVAPEQGDGRGAVAHAEPRGLAALTRLADAGETGRGRSVPVQRARGHRRHCPPTDGRLLWHHPVQVQRFRLALAAGHRLGARLRDRGLR